MDEAVKRRLLAWVRQVITAQLAKESQVCVDEQAWPELSHAGAFVTLRHGEVLRGCIGTFHPVGSLPSTIREMAISACQDPRFIHNPIVPEELPLLDIEISVLSPLVRTDDPLALELGKHGVYIRSGSRSGCFLPQVATEMEWDKPTFLSQCCAGKAGLPADAWQQPDTEVYLFTTESFSESELG